MSTTVIVIIAVAAIAVIAFFLLRAKPAAAPPATRAAHPAEGHGLSDGAAAAVGDVAGDLLGIDAHPRHSGPPDELTLLKGLGPKAAAQLNALGVTRFSEIAAWSEGEIAEIDAKLGAFKGRISRDQWIEQARLLAGGDKYGFEAKFGKLGQNQP